MYIDNPYGRRPAACPDDGQPMTHHLRADDTFVEDDGRHQALGQYRDSLVRWLVERNCWVWKKRKN